MQVCLRIFTLFVLEMKDDIVIETSHNVSLNLEIKIELLPEHHLRLPVVRILSHQESLHPPTGPQRERVI